jgi:hypothetical protein
MPKGYGTHRTAFKDLTGQHFGHWLVLSRGDTRSTRIHWNCRCVCGAEKQVSGVHLVGGKSTNCGCSKPKGEDTARFKHGLSETAEHNIWMSMINRCTNPANKSWEYYGGRGIRVCDRWKTDFRNFLSDMGPRPSADHSVDRFPDQNGDYEPSNCRWATAKEQARNMRRNRMVDLDGGRVSLAEACERTGTNYGAAKWRLENGYDWRGL